jgi:RNA polymerase sigma factor (sigma-70 family)
MSDSDPGSVTVFFQQLQRGDPVAAEGLWLRFFPRMLGLARRTLGGRALRMADADDAVQSAFLSFYQRAGRGDFRDVLDRDELWKLLATMTVRKSLQQARHERAAKRGGGTVADEAALSLGDTEHDRLEDLAASLPTQEFDLRCEELLAKLNDELRTFAVLRLLGHRNREIADLLRCTERKVERKLHLVRLEWEGELAD